MAKELARIENKYPEPLSEKAIYALLKDFRYIVPQGGSMAGIGRGGAFQDNHRMAPGMVNQYLMPPNNDFVIRLMEAYADVTGKSDP